MASNKFIADSDVIVVQDGRQPDLQTSAVTSIGKPRGANKTRRVFWSDGTAWRVPDFVIDSMNVSKGAIYHAKERHELWEVSQRERAKLSALNMLAVRDHTRFELSRKLFNKGFRKEAVDFATSSLDELGLIREEEYANRLAASKLTKAGKGENLVVANLVSKGISRDIAQKAVSAASNDESQFESAVEWLSRSGKKYVLALNSAMGKESRAKLAAALYRRGYNGEVIKRVVNEVSK